jgi:hypothetical protein
MRGEVSLRSALRAPTSRLRSSPPQKSPPPGTARRAGTDWLTLTKNQDTATARVEPMRPRENASRLSECLCPEVHHRCSVAGATGRGPQGAISVAARSAALGSAREARFQNRLRPACLSVTNEVSEASSGRDPRASTAAESARSADRHSMSPLRAPARGACRAEPTHANARGACAALGLQCWEDVFMSPITDKPQMAWETAGRCAPAAATHADKRRLPGRPSPPWPTTRWPDRRSKTRRTRPTPPTLRTGQ